MSGSNATFVNTYKAKVPIGPLVNPTSGVMTQHWLLFFNQIFNRTGAELGSNAVVTADMSDTLQNQIDTLDTTTSGQATQIAALSNLISSQATEISGLTSQVAALQSDAEAALLALFMEA